MKQVKNLVASLVCGMLFLMSCDRTEDAFLSDNTYFTLECVKSSWTPDSRAVITDNGNGHFSEDDCIDVWMKAGEETSNMQLQYVGGKWTPSLKQMDNGQPTWSLSALFPVLSQSAGDVTRRVLDLPRDQSNAENGQEADVLFANTTVSTTDASATLQFKHALHRINIHLNGTVPEDLKLEIRNCTSGEISMVDGSVNLTKTVYSWIVPQKKENQTYTAIILPQSAKAYQSGDGLLRLTSGGKQITYLLSTDVQSFNPGMQTTLNLTLKEAEVSEVDTEFANQTRWVYGITSPVFPGKDKVQTLSVWVTDFPEGEWFRYDYEKMGLLNDENYLTWKEGCGWYDCNKTFGYKGGDKNMCWAATASNLLHWWLAHNRKYVAAYELKYPGKTCPKEYRKMTEADQLHSEIFNFFKDMYPNKGSWETGGVNWFINGDKKNLNACADENFPGFFCEVFSKQDAVATETYNMSKVNFNNWMKEAFKNRKAIGFSVYGFSNANEGLHAMTIWGAEFDEEGNVSYLYFCDNNSAEDEPNHASLRRFKVVYEGSGTRETYIAPLDNVDGTPVKRKTMVCTLTLVDLCQDLWQKAFPGV